MAAALFISISLWRGETGPLTSSKSILQLHLVLGTLGGPLPVLVTCILGEVGKQKDWYRLVCLTLPPLLFSPAEPVVVGLFTIWLHAMATSGFL